MQGIPAAGSLRVFSKGASPLIRLTLTALPEGEPFGPTLSRRPPQEVAASHYDGSSDKSARREDSVNAAQVRIPSPPRSQIRAKAHEQNRTSANPGSPRDRERGKTTPAPRASARAHTPKGTLQERSRNGVLRGVTPLSRCRAAPCPPEAPTHIPTCISIYYPGGSRHEGGTPCL